MDILTSGIPFTFVYVIQEEIESKTRTTLLQEIHEACTNREADLGSGVRG